MDEARCKLVYRNGEEIVEPSPDEILEAVKLLYVEDLPGMAEDACWQHSDAWLRYVEEAGPMYVLTITRRKSARWEEWFDHASEKELCLMQEVESLPLESAVLLCKRLAEGKINVVRAYFQKT